MNLKVFLFIGVLIEAASVFGKYVDKRSLEVAEKDPNYYRLPNDVIPKSYALRIIPVMEVGNFSFKGTVKIKLSIQKSTKSITLHTKGLNVTRHTLLLDTYPYNNISMVNATNYVDRDFHVLYLTNNLAQGQNYTLTMDFTGMLQEDLDGFYICSYKNKSGDTEWMAVTQFEAISARKAFPCFDESHLKANFSISIARPTNMKTLSNMPLKSSNTTGVDLPPGYVLDIYEESPKMSTYLVAFAVSKFIANPSVQDSTFRVWSRKNAISQTNYSAEVGPKIMDVMTNITSINYTLPKMDLVAVPDFAAGAMENWGMVTFRETDLLYRNDSSTELDKQNVITVVAHELSHQWFGDLVSPEWWSYLWLNEGFAEYWMYVVTDLIEPTWRLMEQFVLDNMQTPFISDSMEYTLPIVYNVYNPNNEEYTSSDITYGKAASTIRMMEHVLTRKVFFQGLRRYLTQRQFRAANESMLFDAINVEANGTGALPPNVTVGDVWSTWTDQGGYPVITVNRDYELGKAVIDQKRFVLENFEYNKTRRWWIPISYTTEVSPNFIATGPSNWISPNDTSIIISDIPLNAGWVIFNIQQTGYYRVNYDEQNWRLIISYLKSKNFTKIHPVNRGQLLDDALNLARGGYINYSLALDLSQFLERETDFIPWYSAYNLLDFLDVMMSNSKSYFYFQTYMRNLLTAQYDKLTFNESWSDDHVTLMSRSMHLPWACRFDVGNCVTQANQLFHQWNTTQVNTIPTNLRRTVYCSVIYLGGIEEWNFLWKAYENTTIASEKSRIMEALGCSSDPVILTGYLNKTVDRNSTIRLQDRALVFKSVYTRLEGLSVALDFFIDRFKEILDTCGISTVSDVILGISSRITTEKHAYQMLSFFNKNLGSLAGAEDSVRRSENYTASNIKWVKHNSEAVDVWLRINYPSSSTPQQTSLVLILVAVILSYLH